MNTRLYVLRAAGTATALLALYTAFGFLAVPAIIKSQAQSLAAEKLHRQLTIEAVDFNPYTLALSVRGIKMMEAKGGKVFVSTERIGLDLAAASLWRMAPVIEQLRVEKPYLHLVRTQDGHYSIDDILALLASTPPSPEPARFSLNNIAIEAGRIVFDDQPAGSTHKVEQLRLGIPSLSSMPAQVQIFVEPLLSAKINGAPLLLKGKARPFADPKDMALELQLDDVDLPRYLAYLPYQPQFKVTGARLDARLTASFRQPHDKGASLVIGGQLQLKDVAVRDGADKPMLKFASLDVGLGSLDIFAGKFDLARIALDGLDTAIVRAADGSLNLAQLGGPALPPAPDTPAKPGPGVRVTLKELRLRDALLHYAEPGLQTELEKCNLTVQGIAADTGKRTVAIAAIASDGAQLLVRRDTAPAHKAAPAATAPAEPAYAYAVDKIGLQHWSLKVDDRTHAEPIEMAFAPLTLDLKAFSSAAGAPMQLALQSGAGKMGKIDANGTLALAPLQLDLALALDKVSLLPLQPYASESVNLRLTQALFTSKGRVALKADAKGDLSGGYIGDASIERLATVDKASASDFVSWKSLALGGMDVQIAPFSMTVDKVALSDFFARVIIDPTGRINLQDVRRTEASGERSLTDAGERAAAPAPVAQAVPAPAPATPLPPIRINSLALSGGRVRFTDNFIRPNYSASLQQLGGSVNGLSSDPAANAELSLRGVVNGAPLSIAGRINPLKRDLFLDVKAEVRGIELATLSAYSDKYVGYGIDKGKLSFEVAYKLDNRQLQSENRLILDQLAFGSESTNPEVKKLPVRLAVALLSDRNGIIDISVPVGGTLDDPQFSIGGIILKIIGNAIMKTVTSPFSLLASAFGSAEELSALPFDAGRATISSSGENTMGTLAKALQERPALKLDIAGHADPAVDLDALKQVSLERKLRTIKTRDLQEAGTELPSGGVVVSAEEYPALLARAFKAETFKKPRNVIGLPKTLTNADMEQMILANVEVDDDDLQSLARRRSQAAKDWLIKNGQVKEERVYIVAAHSADAADKNGKKSGPRVEFALR
ncbi:DUF748 domain-containing protein [Massilia sp. CF038]|uniref:DUF748 domain-containing protein n=1 Tax=Massilia sp. CF038 TaxID=1881045 RepID=UPI000910564F|nr:DUF748 domain-containing protein [Massilia sp. CF038]SHG75258.1 protein of unknown function [Massilia sp. CF038]